MLDIHPAHHAATTWKDFFIHIATIVIGLLIAIGLEQTVEYIHHHHQIAETREALRLEAEANRRDVAQWIVAIRRQHAALDNYLTVLLYLRQHPGTPQAQLPGVLTWHNATDALHTSAWVTARQSSVMALFPEDEVRTYSDFYRHIDLINHANDTLWEDINDARVYAFHDGDPSHMTLQQIDHTMELVRHDLKTLFMLSITVHGLHDDFPDFAQTLTIDELASICNATDLGTDPSLAAPLAQTIQRIDAAGKLKDYFPQANPSSK